MFILSSARVILKQKLGVTVYTKYSRSFFRALSHMLAVGYGESPPQLTSETWVVMVSIVLGCTLFAVFIGMIAKLLSGVDASSKKYVEIVRSRVLWIFSQKKICPRHHRTSVSFHNLLLVIFRLYGGAVILEDLMRRIRSS
jgi:hypothetical protein